MQQQAAVPLFAIGVLCGSNVHSGSRIPEKRFCQRLAVQGERLGLPVIVFGPGGVNAEEGTVTGFMLKDGAWQQRSVAVPAVIYDRRFSQSPRARIEGNAAAAALKHCGARWLSGSLPSKLEVHRALLRDPQLKPLLPPTARYRGPGQLTALLARRPEGLFLKPAAGMQGRGTVAIRPDGDEGWLVVGRNRANVSYRGQAADPSQLAAIVSRAVQRGRSYIVQPLLQLSDPHGIPYDIRVLVQKDGSGQWRTTGSAVRAGAAGTATANLHGGGRPHAVVPYLGTLLSRTAASALAARIEQAALQAAAALELAFGRFAELGIDFGVEPDGRLWLIEANARPGRSIFDRPGEEDARMLSVTRPLQYAAYLVRRTPMKTGTTNRNPTQEVHS